MKSKNTSAALRLCAVLSLFCSALTAAEKPNVILILTDDQGFGDFSCHGNPVLKTPNMDRLHSESVHFTDFNVAPMCSPTRGQLMTGRDGMNPNGNRGQRPIAAANVQIGGANYTLDAAAEATHVTFHVALQPGEDLLLTHFLDDQDQTLCSAMYVKLTRLPSSAHVELTPVYDRTPAGVAKPSTPPASRATLAPAKPIPLGKADILIADFEGDGYGDWMTEVSAFGAGRTETKNRIAGYQGKQVVDTFLINGSDKPTGTLTSPSFTIERRYLKLLIGGGRHPQGTGVALWVNGKSIHTATGNSTKNAKRQKILQWVSWDLSALKGKQAQIEIFDRVSGG